MLLESGMLQSGVSVVAATLGGLALAVALFSEPWRAWLHDSERQWVWFGSMALLVVVWSMKAGITPGLSVRFLLVTALTLMHGWQLAIVAGALVLVVLSVVGIADWHLFGSRACCASGWSRPVEPWPPRMPAPNILRSCRS